MWRDGIVLSCQDSAAPGTNLRIGRIPSDEAVGLSARLAEVGFLDLPDTYEVGMHAPSTRIIAEHEGRRRKHEWDEVQAPAHFEWYPDSAKRTFKTIWVLARTCLASVRPTRSSPVEDVAREGAFRGYRLDRPYETPWLR